MSVPILSTKRPESLTQAYHAGLLVAQIENYLPQEKVPGLATCIVHFHSLRELLGERLWQKLKARKLFHMRVKVYEAFTYQPFLPKEMIGTDRDFILGYCRGYERSKLKFKTDKLREDSAKTILNHVSALLKTD